MNNKVTFICGKGGSGKTRTAIKMAKQHGSPFKVFYWDSMQKSMSWIDKRKGDVETIIIEGLTFKDLGTSQFLKTLMDESEQYLVFTMLTDRPMPELNNDSQFSRIDRVIDLNAKA